MDEIHGAKPGEFVVWYSGRRVGKSLVARLMMEKALLSREKFGDSVPEGADLTKVFEDYENADSDRF